MLTSRELLEKNGIPVESILHSKKTISDDVLDSPCEVLESGSQGELYSIDTRQGDNFYTEIQGRALLFYDATELIETLPKHTLLNPSFWGK